jgi:hypothetical protein
MAKPTPLPTIAIHYRVLEPIRRIGARPGDIVTVVSLHDGGFDITLTRNMSGVKAVRGALVSDAVEIIGAPWMGSVNPGDDPRRSHLRLIRSADL